MDGDHIPSSQDESSSTGSSESGDSDSLESSLRPVALESVIPKHLMLTVLERLEKNIAGKRTGFRLNWEHSDGINLRIAAYWHSTTPHCFAHISIAHIKVEKHLPGQVLANFNLHIQSHLLSSLLSNERSHAIDHLSPKTPDIGIGVLLTGQNARYKTDFEEIEKLAKGGYGSVYKAKNILDQREYAVKKILLKQQRHRPIESAQKILLEVQLLASLDHDNIVGYNAAWIEAEPVCRREMPPNDPGGTEKSALEVSTTHTEPNLDISYKSRRRRKPTMNKSGQLDLTTRQQQPRTRLAVTVTFRLYIQMHLCSSTLAGWLERRNETLTSSPDLFKGVDASLNMQIFEGIMNGVQYIHSKGVMHRDLTPKNIFLDGDNLHVRIGDFGLAKYEEEIEGDRRGKKRRGMRVEEVGINRDGTCTSKCSRHTPDVGTLTYAAPEQLSGCDYDSKSDMYSAGIILFELFHPFSTCMEQYKCIELCRNGCIATEVTKRWPKESVMMKKLVAAEGKERPSADEVLQSELFVSKDEMICRLQTRDSEQSKLVRQLQAELRDARQLLKEKDALIKELQDKAH
ncbi:eukaryotic translation initiation factor 2-alpha kinase 1-like [Amphiura filiformis]|uniref:eukaryotic translation initiation factor 2-alpha kinase 1-like n=1 Tax=Amphiura filiformis TaxID=82378 RepID=UPI003B213510